MEKNIDYCETYLVVPARCQNGGGRQNEYRLELVLWLARISLVSRVFARLNEDMSGS